MDWQWLTGPAVGAVIGYITNDIAVRMMLHPHKEKRLFGKRLPFTPGLIPKGRPRLARAIRDVLDQELLSAKVLEAALLSETMLEKIGQLADSAISGIKAEARSPRALLHAQFGEAPVEAFEAQAKRTAGIFLMEKILESGIERTVATTIVEEAKKMVSGSPAALLTLFLDDKRSAGLSDKLAQAMREKLAATAPSIIDGMIDSAVHESLDAPVGELAGKYGEKLGDIRAFLIEQYIALIRKGLTGALNALDLGEIVEQKINGLDMAELEALIMQVMKRELRAIVWLGALLGAIMGLANTVVSLLL